MNSKIIKLSEWPQKKFILSFLLYAIIDIIIFGYKFLNSGLDKSCIGWTNNFYYFVWIISWWRHSITHISSPFFTNFIWFNNGVNLSWNALFLPAIGIITFPFTYIFNYIELANLFMLTQPLLASFFAFVLFYKLTNKFSGSFVGGYIYGFSSYIIEEAVQSLPNNISVFSIPIVALLCYMIYKNEMSRGVFLVLCSIILAFQAGTFLEIYMTLIIFSFLSIMISYFFVDKEKRRNVIVVFLLFTLSFIISLIIISPIIYNMLVSHFYSGSKFGWFGTNIASMILPSRFNEFGFNQGFNIGPNTGPWSTSGYIGIPLIIFISYFMVSSKYDNHLYLKYLFILMFIFTLGRNIYVTSPVGPLDTARLPWYITKFIPIIKDAQPHRFFIYLDLLIGAMIAYYSSAEKYSWRKIAVLIIIPISLFPTRHLIQQEIPETPKFFGNQYEKLIKKDSVVLIYGTDGYTSGMLYQAIDNFYYKIPQGISEGPGTIPAVFSSWSAIQNTRSDNFSSVIHRFINEHNVNYIAVDKDQHSYINKISSLCSTKEYIGGIFLCTLK